MTSQIYTVFWVFCCWQILRTSHSVTEIERQLVRLRDVRLQRSEGWLSLVSRSVAYKTWSKTDQQELLMSSTPSPAPRDRRLVSGGD